MSDSTDFTIIIVLLFGFTFYIYYLRKIIDALYDINNIKCNPVNLFLKSIHAEPSESIDEFAQCVQLLGSPNDIQPIANTDANNISNNSSIAINAANKMALDNYN
jgi:hypothetical protein